MLIAAFQLLAAMQSSWGIPVVWLDVFLGLALAALAWRRVVPGRIAVAFSAVVLCLLADPAVGAWVAVWGILLPMFLLIRAVETRLALFGYGQWIGSLIACGLFSWLWGAMRVFFELSPIATFLLFLLSCLLIGLQFSIFCLLTRIVTDATRWPVGLVGALVYTLVEFWSPFPFPIKLAIAFSGSPVWIQIGDLVGMTGISLAIALVAGLLFTLWEGWQQKYRRKLSVCAAGLVILLGLQLAYGLACLKRYRPSPQWDSLDVAMIQPVSPLKIDNADHETKVRVAETLVSLSTQAVTAAPGKPDLLIWPEGASSFSYRTPKFNPEYGERLSAFQQKYPVTMILQDVEFVRIAETSDIRYFSTVTLVDTDGSVQGGYRKNILLPFAEYLPGERTFPFLRALLRETRSILKGNEKTLLHGPRGPFVSLICYEIVFGDFVREFVRQEEQPRYIINLTNDRWYGPRQQPRQHLSFAVFRAVENRLPVIRSTNSGISALVDARGVIVPENRTGVMEQTILRGTVHLPEKGGLTLYSRWGDVIPKWILPPLYLLSLFGAFVSRRSKASVEREHS